MTKREHRPHRVVTPTPTEVLAAMAAQATDAASRSRIDALAERWGVAKPQWKEAPIDPPAR